MQVICAVGPATLRYLVGSSGEPRLHDIVVISTMRFGFGFWHMYAHARLEAACAPCMRIRVDARRDARVAGTYHDGICRIVDGIWAADRLTSETVRSSHRIIIRPVSSPEYYYIMT